MKQEAILDKLQSLKSAVKKDLRDKGLVVPVKTKRGLILDDYEIVLDDNGYQILDKYKEKCYSNLHYMQTAVIIANALALKRAVKTEWVLSDSVAGSSDFDLKVFERRFKKSVKENDSFGICHYQTRITETKLKHKSNLDAIDSAYLRLVNSVKSLEKSNKYS